ncbi:MAG: chemotaxis protein CheW [Candidatus Methanoperedens sp.]
MQIVVFSLDEHRYALKLSTVERIVRVVEVIPLPKAPDIVMGVVNVQGRIIPVLNIRKRFGLPEREIYLSDHLIIAQTSKRSIALLADKVSGVIEYPEQEKATLDTIFPGIEYVEAIIKQEEGMIQIIKLETILSAEVAKSMEDGMKEPPGDKNDNQNFR